MEMTGLDVETERVLEIATIITDGNLNIVALGPDLVVKQPLKVLKAMDDWNQKHHRKSGLYDLVRASKITVKQAEKQTLAFVKKYCFERISPLCGNTIDQDRRFITKYMPKLGKYFHYRNIDVSSIKTLVKLWYPKDKKIPKKEEAHRALSDIRESIEELKYYREHYFTSKRT